VEVDVGVAEQLRGEVAERVDAVRLGHGEQAGRVADRMSSTVAGSSWRTSCTW
jgi:hypothetical protein